MPDGRPLMPRIRMPRITRPGRASRAAEEGTAGAKPVTKPDQAAAPGNGTEPATKVAPPTGDPGKEAPTKEATPAAAGAAGAGAAGASPASPTKPTEVATVTEPSLQ